MRNAKKTLSLVMVAIFTTFIVLSGIPAGAVTTAQAKAQVTKATAAVVKVEKTVKVATFSTTTAQTQLNAAVKEVAKVKTLGKTYAVTYNKLVARDSAVAKKIAAKKAADLKKAQALAKLFTDADKAVAAAEKATDSDTVDLVADATALANAQGAVTAALELIVKLSPSTSNYKGLMARVDAVNGLIVKAMDEIAAAEAAAAEIAAKEAAAKAALEAAEKAVAAVEAAPLVTAADLTAALELGKTAATAVAAVTDAEKAAAFTARLKVVADKALVVKAKLEADAAAAAEALKPATLVAVSAVDGTITVTFNKKPITTVTAIDFTVTKTVTTTGAVTTSVAVGTVTVVSDTAVTFTVPAIAAATTDQSVVYTVQYTTGTAIAAVAYNVAKIPSLTATLSSITNLKEVVLNFNKEIDATLGADVANYSVKVSTTDKGVAKATVSADKKSVVLTLTNNVLQQDTVTVTAKKALGLDADLVLTGAAMDVTIPEIQTITLTGPNTFDVTFSEPVQATGSAAVLVNNGVYGVTSAVLSTNKKLLTITLSASSLTAGDYTVKVSGYSDYANFMAVAKTFTVGYVVNTTAPVATLTSATQTTVKVTFDKAVYQKGGTPLNANYFYQTYSAWKPYTVTTTDNKVFTLSFVDADPATVDPILPVGSVNVTVLKSVSDVPVVDAWGNEMAADAKLVATVTADTVAPTLTAVSASAENAIDVTYSEDVVAPTADMFVIKDKDAKVVTPVITSIDYDADTYTATLNLSAKLAGGTYTVEVKNTVDTSFSANKITTVTKDFTVTDLTAMDLSTVTTALVDVPSLSVQYIYISFPEAVSQTSALLKDNYLVAGAQLKTADKVEMFGTNGKKVRLTIAYRGTVPAVVVPNTGLLSGLVMGRIADLAGNLPLALATTIDIAPDTVPTAFTAKATGLNKFELTFTGELKTVPADGITSQFAAGLVLPVAAVNSVVYSSTTGKTVVTVTTNANASLASKISDLATLNLAVVADKIETITGNMVGAIGAVNPTDGIKPALIATTPLVQTTVDKFTMTFDEPMAVLGGATAIAASDLVITDKDGETLVPFVNYTVAPAASTIEVTLVGDYAGYDGKLTVSTKATVTYITDANDNTAVVFTGKTVTMDATAPTAALVTPFAKTGYAATNTMTIKFSEPVAVAAIQNLANLVLSAHVYGVGSACAAVSPVGGYATTFTITLAGSPTVVAGDTITINKANVVDAFGNAAAADVVFTLN